MEITQEQVKEYSKLLHRKEVEYKENEAYVKGKNPEIFREAIGKDPDNRIPIPFAKMAVEDMAGYAARPGDISIYYDNITSDTEDAENDEYNDIVKGWFEDNEDDIEISELYHKMLAHGKDYELWWTVEGDETPVKPQWKRVPAKNVVMVYSNDLRPEKLAALYYRSFEDKEVCDVYYPKKSERFEKHKNKAEWIRNEEEDTEYPYTVVPVLEFTGNMDAMPIFEAEKKLCDAQDNLLSKSVNEIDRFNALIALFPGKVTKDFVDKLKEYKIIDELGEWEHWPEYLEKNLSGVNEFYNDLADRLERLFHKSIKIPDFSSETFGSADQSGVARAYKLLGMEFKASMIETYFFRGLKERKQLIDDVIRASSKNLPVDKYKTVITSKRNLPVDKAAAAEIAMKLQGIVSKKTLLKILPAEWIEDVEKEMNRLEEEGQARIEMLGGNDAAESE